MPSKRRAPLTLGLVLAAAAALVWTEIVLLSQNTLFLNGNWISFKRKQALTVMGADSFLIARSALGRNRLNMGSWFGFNGVLFKDALRPKEFRFKLTLDDEADLSVLFPEKARDGAPGAVSGFRLSRNPSRGAMFFESAPSGRFLSKSAPIRVPLGARRHLVSLRFLEGRARVSVDGQEVASRGTDTESLRFLGLRAGGGNPIIDDVFIEDVSGRVERDFFRNTRHLRRIFLLHAAVVLLLFGAASLIPSLDPAAPLLALAAVGSLWLGFDYSFWSGVRVDALSRPLDASTVSSLLERVERVRYQAFKSWNGLLTGAAPVTPQALLRQGNPPGRSQEALYCSASEECLLALEPPPPAQKQAYRILLVGTSQAWGAGTETLEDTFFVSTHRRLARHFKGRLAIESLNMSISGSDASSLLADYKSKYVGFNPDLVLISLGNNGSPETLRSGLSGFLGLNKSKGIKTILLKEAQYRGGGPAPALKLGIVQKLGESFQVPVYDLNGFLNDPRVSDSGFLWWDYVHLTTYGQALVSEWLSPKVIEFIETEIGSPG